MSQNGEHGECEEIVPLIVNRSTQRAEWDDSDNFPSSENPKNQMGTNGFAKKAKNMGTSTSMRGNNGDDVVIDDEWSVNHDDDDTFPSAPMYAPSERRNKNGVSRSVSSFMSLQDIVENYYSVSARVRVCMYVYVHTSTHLI